MLLTFHGLWTSALLHRCTGVLNRSACLLRVLALVASPGPDWHSWLQSDSERAG